MARLPRHVFRRGERYYVRVIHHGREYRRSLGTNLEEARRTALLFVKNVRRTREEETESRPTDDTAGAATLWLDKILPQSRCSRAVANARNRMARSVLPVIPANLSEVRYSHLRAVRALAESNGLKPSTVADTLSDLRAFLNWAVHDGLIQRSPWGRKIMPRLVQKAPDRLSDEMVAAILTTSREPHRSQIELSLLTGLRRGELIALQWRHVRLGKSPHLIVEAGKTGRVRRVPLVPRAVEIVRELRASTSSVFISESRAPNAANAVRQTGLKWHWHQLRHTFACRYLEAGGSLAALQRILGHASVRMTERYAAMSDEAVFADAERISGQFGVEHGTNDGTPEKGVIGLKAQG